MPLNHTTSVVQLHQSISGRACRDLNALFEELVRQSGSISEQEFWAGRQHLLRKQQGESGAQKQRAGLGNAMLLAVRPSADGKTNTVGTLLQCEQDDSILHIHTLSASCPAACCVKTHCTCNTSHVSYLTRTQAQYLCISVTSWGGLMYCPGCLPAQSTVLHAWPSR